MNPKKIVRRILPPRSIRLAEETYRKTRVYSLQARRGFPARGLKIIAVTGTNGKTTTCCYVNALLKSAGYSTALYSTAVIEVAGVARLNKSHRTVPLTAELLRFFHQAKQKKVDYVILETTSQALDQHKLLGVKVEVAAMTNLTQDHLDYHKTMAAYAAAKARLFNGYLRPKYTLFNHDDAWFDYFYNQAVGERQSYGLDQGSTYRITAVKLQSTGSDWRLNNMPLQTHLPGRFNVLNASAAAGIGMILGLTPQQISNGIASLAAVPGRMELIDCGQKFSVIVDYAHTPDALENVLQAAHQVAKGRVIAVFGATGDRDKAKRPVMGQAVAAHADLVFLTDDETYNEDPAAIRATVRQGLVQGRAKYQEIGDRASAISAAFAAAQAGDIVVLAGIGHQDSRNMGGKLEQWDERDVARQLLRPYQSPKAAH